jgi:hypothetical protein
LFDLALDRSAGLADDRLALGGADVDLDALLVERGILLFIYRLVTVSLGLGPAALALAAFQIALAALTVLAVFVAFFALLVAIE